jgi:glycosyltransferase involved in cell wall biosynthesis
VIPNATSRRPQAGGAKRKPVVLAFGRLEPSKNFGAVVDAARYLPDSFRVQVVGDGSARVALERRAAAHGNGRVEFLGQVPDERVDRALAECAVMVTMSDREAFGLAAFEALASGAPVVASDIPAHRELRDRYGAGCMHLVPIGAPAESLAHALVDAAEAGCTPSRELPSWDRVAEMTLDLYMEVLDQGA